MKPSVLKCNSDEERLTGEACYINELSNSTHDTALSVAQARVSVGVTTRWHRLKDTTERYVILEGQGSVEIGSLSPQEVTAGDVVLIPPMCEQRITNTGTKDLLFLAICSPRFQQENYEDLG